jgi:putative spermidine/putrescine transport system ATP-binding protein
MPSPTAGAATLELDGLVKRYGETVALDGISLRVEPGEFVSLLGPSGSGKTTTLNLIAGFAKPTAGDILMDGRPIAELPPHRRHIGVVFQHYALFPHMTAAQNVGFPLRQRNVPRSEIRERVASALGLVELGGLADRHPRELSGGQQQRVALARAIVFNPRLLLMDEPLGALDRKLRDALQRQIKRLHRELGITFVYVTHDQDEALALSERVAVFNHGRVEQLGTPVELYERPSSRFVAEFLGESNLFTGPIHRSAGDVTLRSEGRDLPLPANSNPSNGARGALMVRPEHVHLIAASEAQGAPTKPLSGVVRDLVYLGASVRIEIELDSETVITVRRPSHEPPAIGIGDRVAVTWDPDHSVLLRGDVERDPQGRIPRR